MIQILIVLIVVGVALYLLNQYVPMAAPFKTIVNVVAVLFLILWLLSAFGILSGNSYPRLR